MPQTDALADLITALPVANLLGEGVLWNAADGAFWWTDIQARRLYRHHLASGETESFPTPERLCCFAFMAGDARLLAAFESGVALFDHRTGAIERLAKPTLFRGGRRLNDGRVDRQGRFWVGTMCEGDGGAKDGSAALYRFGANRRLERQLKDVTISNGLCWSPDGTRMYFADSPRQTITAFAFDPASGTISDPQPFAKTTGDAFPDGATVDAEGHLWSAQWGGSQVVRYGPDGAISGVLPVAASRATCLAFGGPDLDMILVTTARDGMSTAELEREPQAGHAFLYRARVRGLEEVAYRP